MSYIATVADDEATSSEDAGRFFAADRETYGYVANFTRLLAQRPDVLVAWQQLSGAVRGGMDLRRYELATVAAARELRSSYCALAHGKILAEQFLGDEAVRDLVSGRPSSALDDVDTAVVELSTKVVRDAAAITEHDFEDLRALGVSDGEVFSIVLAAALRCFFSKVLDGTGTQADVAFDTALDPATRDALTVGRPIAPSG